MPAPINQFKRSILAGERQIGLWLAMANAYSAEISAGTGFDWVLIDAEHAPNDIGSILAQLQAVAPYDANPVVRLIGDDSWIIKQALDIGAQTLLIPMVESGDQARRLVSATRYAPEGTRGIGAALARASQFNATKDYITTAGDQICLLVQVETRAGIAAIPDLLSVDGVDGIFVGPSDLAADMGHPGNAGHPSVQAVVRQALMDIKAGGKPAGILSSAEDQLRSFIDLGATFVAVGTDIGILTGGLRDLRAKY